MNKSVNSMNNNSLNNNTMKSTLKKHTLFEITNPDKITQKFVSKETFGQFPKKKDEFIGPFSLSIDEDVFKKLNPPETNLDKTEKKTYINIIENGPQFKLEKNAYDLVVNTGMIESNLDAKRNSFKAKSIYNKAVELSKNPKNAKMDNTNPIFFFVTNSSEYRHYKVVE